MRFPEQATQMKAKIKFIFRVYEERMSSDEIVYYVTIERTYERTYE